MGRTGSKEHRARARLYKLIECIISLHGQTECFGLLFQFFFSFSLLLGFGELSHAIEPSYLRIHSAKQSRLRQTECSHRKDVDKKLNEWSNVHCTSHPALSACWHISRFFLSWAQQHELYVPRIICLNINIDFVLRVWDHRANNNKNQFFKCETISEWISEQYNFILDFVFGACIVTRVRLIHFAYVYSVKFISNWLLNGRQ